MPRRRSLTSSLHRGARALGGLGAHTKPQVRRRAHRKSGILRSVLRALGLSK